ncbi:lipopolysaccharide biosynthesis protein [Enterobacter hormaechei]
MKEKQHDLKAGFKWSAIERIITQFAQLLVLLVLARILGPKAYGLVGMLTIFIAVSQTLVDSGFSSALIRRNNNTQKQYSTIFWFNFGTALFLYIVIFFSAKEISHFFNEPQLEKIIKILGLVIIINALCIVHRTKLTINLDFKSQSQISFLSVLISGVGSIVVAINGGGVWSIVFNNILFSLLSTIMYFYKCKWVPNLVFNRRFFYATSRFSGNLLVASLLNTFFDNLYQLVIGKFFNTSQVGFFTQAKNLTLLPTNTYSAIIQRVTYRYFSEIKNNRTMLNKQYEETVKYATVIFFPLIFGLAFFSENIVSIILGKEWIITARYIFVLCFCYCFYPIHALSLNVLNVYGRSNLFLKLEVFKKILISLLMIATIKFGIEWMCWGLVLYSVIATYINSIYTNKFLDTTFMKLLSIISPAFIISLVSFFVSHLIINNLSNEFLKLGGLLFGCCVYFMTYYVYDKNTVKTIYFWVKRNDK